MILIRTEQKGWLSGVTLSAILAQNYGLMAKYVAWEEVSDDGVVALICFKSRKYNGYNVIDHVYEVIPSIERDQTKEEAEEKFTWL